MFLGLMAAGIVLAGITQSCVSDAPFIGGDGEGTLRMKLVVNSDLTRAQAPADELADSCVVYISNASGLLYSFQGLDNLPPEIKLKSGHYVAEAWTGDSVTASWGDRFYRGYQAFDIDDDSDKSVVVTCRIANVVVSMDEESVMPELGDDWTLTVSNSRGSLEFNKDNMESAQAFFMMPNCDIAVDENGNYIPDDPGFTKYTNLRYHIEGTNAAGDHFEKDGDIGKDGGNLVQHAHEYRLKLRYNPEYEDNGGGFITIVVEDNEVVIESEVGIYSRPAIKGVTFDIDGKIKSGEGDFAEDYEAIVKVSAFNGIKNLQLIPSDGQAIGVIPATGFDLKGATAEKQESLKAAGIIWDEKQSERQPDLYTSYITFKPLFLNTLTDREEDYGIRIRVLDGNGRENEAVMTLAIGAAAEKMEDPVKIPDMNEYANEFTVLSNMATICGEISADAVAPQIKYRKAGETAWSTRDIVLSRANQQFSVVLTGLEAGQKYEYKACAEGWEEDETHYFETEKRFVIPFADMETWSKKGNAPFVGDNYDNNFWDSGNHGGASFGFTMTTQSNVMYNSPSSSACLKSVNAAVKFAAGNLFVGKFGATVGTSGARLQFGQPFNGSHPSALSVYVSYTPQKITHTSTDCPVKFTKGQDYDQGQVYIAIATEPISVNTGTSDNGGVPKKTFMNFDDPRIIAFGEKTWADGETAGTATSLEKVVIPLTWRKGSESKKANTIIIVCSASKYGDYFTGAEKSVMYLDDFGLIYEEITKE